MNRNTLSIGIFCLVLFSHCNKLVEIPPPVNAIVSEEAFSTEANANASISGIYSKLFRKGVTNSFGNGWITFFLGLSSDELRLTSLESQMLEFYRNGIRPVNALLPNVWNNAYETIYQSNAAVEELSKSKGISSSSKSRFLAEVRFTRAFSYYYLSELFGGVPLVLTTDWKVNSLAKRVTIEEINGFITKELMTISEDLDSDYNRYSGERVRATKWAVYALLTKVYLRMKNWQMVEKYSTFIIENASLFQLSLEPGQVFLKNSDETILQWHNSSDVHPFNVLPEAITFLPANSSVRPSSGLSESLLKSFDTADLRRKQWVLTTKIAGTNFYSPNKYKVGRKQMAAKAPTEEYYSVFRLAEVVLNRAEARVHLGMVSSAMDDINLIRARSKVELLDADDAGKLMNRLIDERQKELFCEWGDRWFTMRRTMIIDSVMVNEAVRKGGSWQSFRQYFPISESEILRNNQCVQNPGYN